MSAVVAEMRSERIENAKTYLRADVYEARYESSMKRLETLEIDSDAKEKSAEQFRRQVFVAIISFAIPAVFGLILAVNNFLASGGQTP